MNTKKQYISPILHVVTFKVEQGFNSYVKLSHSIIDNDLYNAQNQEKWYEGGSLFGDNDW